MELLYVVIESESYYLNAYSDRRRCGYSYYSRVSLFWKGACSIVITLNVFVLGPHLTVLRVTPGSALRYPSWQILERCEMPGVQPSVLFFWPQKEINFFL